MLELLLGLCIVAPREVHHRGYSQLVSRVGVHAGHMKCRDVARKLLTVFFTAHHVRVANLYIRAARSEVILASYSHLPRQGLVGRVLVERRPVMTAVDGRTGCRNE